METRIAKKSRFRIDKLEERVAPSAFATAHTYACASGQVCCIRIPTMLRSRQSFGGVSAAVAGSISAAVGVTI